LLIQEPQELLTNFRKNQQCTSGVYQFSRLRFSEQARIRRSFVGRKDRKDSANGVFRYACAFI